MKKNGLYECWCKLSSKHFILWSSRCGTMGSGTSPQFQEAGLIPNPTRSVNGTGIAKAVVTTI